MSGGEVVCSGWLRKSPPEKKLKRYAWKRRWFVLRSGRLTGDPDVLEYYKNDHAKKPIRIIDLNLCQQVDAGLTFNKKEFENSYIFDINTIDRIFYLVADSEEEMNKWVRCICDICGFNPTEEDPVKPPGSSLQVDLPSAVITTPPSAQVDSSSAAHPPPYQLLNLPPHLETLGIQEDPQDYLLLVNCQSKIPEPTSQGSSFVSEEGEEYLLLEDFESKTIPLQTHADSAKSTSSETDCNDNVPAHKAPAPSKPGLNGFFPQHLVYDSPPPRAAPAPADAGLYSLPRSFSHDLLPRAAPAGADADGELYVFNTPLGTAHVPVSYDIPPTPGNAYQIPRTFPDGPLGQTSKLDPIPDVPPPRPPKPHAAHDRSPVEAGSLARAASDTDTSYCVPVPAAAGMPASRSNTISTVDLNKLRKAKPAPLEIKPLPEWEELQAPVRSPITRSFARDSSRFPMSPRPDSVHSTTSSSDSHDSEENYVPMNPNLSGEDSNLFGSSTLDGGSSPMIKPKGDKQVEYLDLDLDSGKSTPPRKQKISGPGSGVADERVDYVVVDQQKTLALKSTREAWTDGRQSTESETPTKSVK
ncbi:GRB2-associated-binding protein 1 isoform X6 [Pipistrellus kuhlii]|uniref:GRB2-associated-binding protein 1 isoform X6 n=1 Tax=Pipistrellus kuhlii TaxID=59472 RepID=UPI001E274AA0|nr:GRB2-associated-binding protein 1 isoform X6 [Pipistrellus kuhlii]